MKRMSPLLIAASLLFGAVLLSGPGCSNQGEGERCDPLNNNDDCASGLECQKIEGQKSALCCPPAPQPASVPECIPGTALVPDGGGSDSATVDTGKVDTGSGDAAKDVSSDVANAEGGQDASPDAEEASLEAGADDAGE